MIRSQVLIAVILLSAANSIRAWESGYWHRVQWRGDVKPLEMPVEKCLRVTAMRRQLDKAIFGDQPTPSLPNKGALCRVQSVQRVFLDTKPVAVPEAVELATATMDMSDEELRAYVDATASHLELWRMAIDNEHRAVARLEDVQQAGALLRTKVGTILSRIKVAATRSEPVPWPSDYDLDLMNVPECQLTSKAKGSVDREVLKAFSFLDEYKRVAFSASLSRGAITPYGEQLCEDGQRHSIGRRDWIVFPCNAGSGCSINLENALPPFFSEGKKAVQARDKDPALLERELSEFDAAVEQTVNSAQSIRRTLFGAWEELRAKIRPVVFRFSEQIQDEEARLLAEASKLSAEQAALTALQGKINERLVAEGQIMQQLTDIESKLVKLSQALSSVREKLVAAIENEQHAKHEIAAADSARGEIELRCGEASYSSCTNEDARRAFDGELYRAGERYIAAIETWVTVIDLITTLIDQEVNYGDAIVRHRNTVLERRQELITIRNEIALGKQEHQSRKLLLAKRTARFNGLADGHHRNVTMLTQLITALH